MDCSRTLAVTLLLWSCVIWRNSLCSETDHEAKASSAEGIGEIARPTCTCDYDQVLDRVPYFLQGIGQTGQFDFAFQGPKGEWGFDGPEGPAGQQGKFGPKGQKGHAGEPGRPGLPGASHVTVSSGLLGRHTVLTENVKGHKGEQGSPGPAGKRGAKGRSGENAAFIIQNGQYTLVKGEKGDLGRRGRKGQAGDQGNFGPSGAPGIPGLSIVGSKGNKGEPAEIPDLELIRGSQGPRGPAGLPGLPGVGGHCVPCTKKSNDEGTEVKIQVKGEAGAKGEAGLPGLPARGEPGPTGQPGPPGPSRPRPPDSEPLEIIPGALVYEFLEHLIYDIDNVDSGTVAFVYETDQLFIRGQKGWKEVPNMQSFHSSDSSRISQEHSTPEP